MRASLVVFFSSNAAGTVAQVRQSSEESEEAINDALLELVKKTYAFAPPFTVLNACSRVTSPSNENEASLPFVQQALQALEFLHCIHEKRLLAPKVRRRPECGLAVADELFSLAFV